MDAALDNFSRLGLLAIPVVLGILATWRGVFEEPERAVRVLNGYALNIGFPALVAMGLVGAELALPTAPFFYAAWPLVLALILAGVWLGGRAHDGVGEQAGTLALVCAFGNVAYLGIPYCAAVLPASLSGACALAVSIHVAGAVTVGPILLARWGGGEPSWRSVLGVLKMPLFWAPALGLTARAMPASINARAAMILEPLSASAAPVALFMLGVYLYIERRRLLQLDAAALAHIAVRLLIAPSVMLAVTWGAQRMGWLDGSLAAVHVILAAMPAAITTFAMAHRAQIGSQRVAVVIVWSSALAGLMLPIWSALALRLFEVSV